MPDPTPTITLQDRVRFAVNRTVTSTNALLEDEISRYIKAAILDLTETTNITAFTADNADSLQQDAVILYACFMFEKDVVRKENYKKLYDDLKQKMHLSSKYNGGVIDDET